VRARVFIDFWNFQLGWNEAASDATVRCDWAKLPRQLVRTADDLLTAAGNPAGLTLEETIVHASVNDSQEGKLREWLTNFLDRQPSYDVKIRERKPRRRTIHCRSCGNSVGTCPNCAAPLTVAAEKGVDAALVTDLLSLAWQRAYDVAVLVSGDSDYIPAVEYVQSQGLKVINAAWPAHGHELQGACWGSFQLDTLIPVLTR
jgi:NYN domain